VTDFSEFMRTASDQQKEAIYNIVLEKSTEEQNKTLEEHLNKTENEQEVKLLTPGADDVFSEQNKRKLFKNKTSMCDYLSMTKAVAGQFRIGDMNGVQVWELVYISEDN